MNQLIIPTNVFWITAKEFYEVSLKELKGKNILLFMSSSNAIRLSLKKWVDSLSHNCTLLWYDKSSSNPTHIDIFDILSKFKGITPDIVVAIGGGSTIDMAKSYVALNYLNSKKQLTKKDVLNCIKTKEYIKYPTHTPIYAIPTTAGTGSEVTRWATVWDLEEERKYSVDSPYLFPKKAYIVPEYTLSMPKRLTLSTGLDALCHAIEAYWAKSTNPMVKELSKAAISLIVEYLPRVLSDTENLYDRKKICLGSLFSGLAFSNTRTTACHSISYPLTMSFGIEHGLACALSLSKVMEINLPVIEEADKLLNALRINTTEELQKWLDKIAGGIVNLRLSSFGIQEKDISKLVNMSFTLGRMNNNPVEITPEIVKRILISIL